ncbi:MAG: hypothetical protein LUD50_07595 [Clostridia bacterium]|nr:hypothetical protein [Clostridia bacterium]
MIDEKKVQYAVKEFCKNHYWRAEYKHAPTPLSKRYVALQFYWSEFTDATDYVEEKQMLEDTMGLEDWEYLYKHAGHDPWGARCRKKVEELKARQQADQQASKTATDKGDTL